MKQVVYNTITKSGDKLATSKSSGIVQDKLPYQASEHPWFPLSFSDLFPPVTCRWDYPITHFPISGHPLTMKFHSYDKHLVIANEHNMIR